VTIFRYVPLHHIYKKLSLEGDDPDEEDEKVEEGEDEDKEPEMESVRRKISFEETSDAQTEVKNDSAREESDAPTIHNNSEGQLEGSPIKKTASENSDMLEASTTTTPKRVTPRGKSKKSSSRKSIAKTYSFLTRLFVNNVNKQIRNDVNQTNASVLDLNVFLGQGVFCSHKVSIPRWKCLLDV
jgi:hypothetical protein